MTLLFVIIYTALAILQLLLTIRSLQGGVEFLNYFRSELAKPLTGNTPFTSIFLPCKGVEEGLKENIASLFEQEYPGFEVIFIVDDKSDPAVSVINEFLVLHNNSSLVVAHRSTESGQKVENLREGVLHASAESKVFVFVDSDARPAKNWLRHLISPLADENIGAATGYRWFIAAEGKLNFAAELKSAWNASVTSVLGSDTSKNFCWGGSTATKRETFERLNIREKWRGTLSDDFTLTRVVKQNGLGIYFVPQTLTASFDSSTFGELLEFTNRQIKITRVYSPGHWVYSFIGSGLFCTVFLSTLYILLFVSTDSFVFWFAAFTMLLIVLGGTVKAHLRFKAVMLAMPEHARPLASQWLFQLLLWSITTPLFLYNCIAALFSKRIKWRGKHYEMVSSEKTRIV